MEEAELGETCCETSTSATEEALTRTDATELESSEPQGQVSVEHLLASDSVQSSSTSTTRETGAEDGNADSTRCLTASDAAEQTVDPYSYLSRGDYTSEVYKLELMNLPKRFGIAQLKKKLIFLGVNPCKIKAVDHGGYAFVTFRSEEEREKAISVLQGHVWKSRTIRVKKALPAADPFLLKRKHDSAAAAEDQSLSKPKVQKTEELQSESEEISASERLNNTVSPLWKMSYTQQLQTKSSTVRKFVKSLGREIDKNNDQDRKWLAEQRKQNGGLCCTLLDIKPSPIVNGYRNKCEFTIGRNPDQNENTVGFRLGSYKSGDLSVLEPADCVLIPDNTKLVAKELQSCLQNSSTKFSFNPVVRQGHWQTATVRTTCRGQTMLIVAIHPQSLTREELNKEKELLRQHFEDVNNQQMMVSSMYFQVTSDRGNEQAGECEAILGEKYIEEDLLQMTFRISPFAFFQVNSAAAEVLYTSLAEMCHVDTNTTLLDVCCGTGTIGLTMARKAKRVIGIEISPEAVEDARVNAQINGIENAEFLCGKVEEVLPGLMSRLAGQEVVMVVDPPRAGLHSDVIRVIRRSQFVERLLYVSCKPTAAQSNIVDLTRRTSKRVLGIPFRLKEILPVDLFPHTDHYELIFLLERNSATATS